MKQTRTRIPDNVNTVRNAVTGSIILVGEKKIYWLTKGPHCDEAREVIQTDGITAYVCEHISPTNESE